jgi:hypothetical protein
MYEYNYCTSSEAWPSRYCTINWHCTVQVLHKTAWRHRIYRPVLCELEFRHFNYVQFSRNTKGKCNVKLNCMQLWWRGMDFIRLKILHAFQQCDRRLNSTDCVQYVQYSWIIEAGSCKLPSSRYTPGSHSLPNLCVLILYIGCREPFFIINRALFVYPPTSGYGVLCV